MRYPIMLLTSTAVLLTLPIQANAAAYTVNQGDTLSKIARIYHTTAPDLIQLNQLSSDKLSIGQTLQVPDNDASVPVNPVDTPQPAQQVSQPQHAEPAKGSSTAYVNVPTLNVRQQPSTESAILTKVTYGTALQVIEFGTEWTSIMIEGQQAYVATPYISETAPHATETMPIDSREVTPEAETLYQLISPLLQTPYRTGGDTPDGFDCSGFTSYVFHQLGVTLPRTSEEQFASGMEVPYAEAVPGDLLFYDSLHKGKVSHVAIYIGNGNIVHANGEKVTFEKVEYMNKLYPFYGVKRYLSPSKIAAYK